MNAHVDAEMPLPRFPNGRFTGAAFEAFTKTYLCFSVSASAKKNAEVIKFKGFLKNMFPRIKVFLFKKEKQFFA